jgi:hypothetical protein
VLHDQFLIVMVDGLGFETNSSIRNSQGLLKAR